MFQFLGPYHPMIVHTPVALLVFSAFFALVGRLFDREWVRKTSMLLLVFGFLGAWFAFQSGHAAHHVPERKQGVPEEAIDEHAEFAKYTLWAAGAAVVAYAATTRLSGGAAAAVGMVALLLQLAAAVLIGVTGFRGGDLVFDYGANVKVGGVLVKNPGTAERGGGAEAGRPAARGGGHEERDHDGD